MDYISKDFGVDRNYSPTRFPYIHVELEHGRSCKQYPE